MQVAAISVSPPYSVGLQAWQTVAEGSAGARRGPSPRPVQPEAAGRSATSAGQADVQAGFAEGERRSAPAVLAEAAWYGRRHGPAGLLAAMIENMGGASTSAYKGMYVDVRV